MNPSHHGSDEQMFGALSATRNHAPELVDVLAIQNMTAGQSALGAVKFWGRQAP